MSVLSLAKVYGPFVLPLVEGKEAGEEEEDEWVAGGHIRIGQLSSLIRPPGAVVRSRYSQDWCYTCLLTMP
jgi:hypothetical protein